MKLSGRRDRQGQVANQLRINGASQLTEDTPSLVISANCVSDSGRFVLSHLAQCEVQRSDGSYQSLANFNLRIIGAIRPSLL